MPQGTASPSPIDGALLTAAEVALILGVSRRWVEDASRDGTLPTVRVGRFRRFRRAAIDSWLAAREAQAA
jgi:excisionase family DNA binding protein